MSEPTRHHTDDRFDEFNPKRLDVIATAREAYSGAWTHLAEMLRLIWLPGVLYLALSLSAALLVDKGHALLRSMLEFATLFLWPIIAVAWHRFILVGDAPSGTYQLRFGRREARFLLISFFLMLLLMPGFVIAAMTAALKDIGSAASLIGFVGILLVCVGIYFLVRLLLLLPAVAVDEPINVRLILERTRGNFWRLVALCLLASLPILVLIAGVTGIFVSANMPIIIPMLLTSLLSIFFGIVNVAILSIAYRDLIGPPGTLAFDLDAKDIPEAPMN